MFLGFAVCMLVFGECIQLQKQPTTHTSLTRGPWSYAATAVVPQEFHAGSVLVVKFEVQVGV